MTTSLPHGVQMQRVVKRYGNGNGRAARPGAPGPTIADRLGAIAGRVKAAVSPGLPAAGTTVSTTTTTVQEPRKKRRLKTFQVRYQIGNETPTTRHIPARGPKHAREQVVEIIRGSGRVLEVAPLGATLSKDIPKRRKKAKPTTPKPKRAKRAAKKSGKKRAHRSKRAK